MSSLAANEKETGQVPVSFNLKGISVFIAMPVMGNIPPETVVSLIDTIDVFRSKGIPRLFQMQIDGDVYESRSIAAASFLASGANRLMFIDSDMVWSPEDALNLIALSTEMDIVVGPYTTRKEPQSFLIKVKDKDAIPVNKYGCAAIDGTGLGFCVVSRSVIETLSKKVPLIKFMTRKPIPHIFRWAAPNGNFQSEDISFFSEAKKAGFQCWMDPTITLGHIGKKIFRASLLDHVEIDDKFMRVKN